MTERIQSSRNEKVSKFFKKLRNFFDVPQGPLNRREFLKFAGLGVAGVVAISLRGATSPSLSEIDPLEAEFSKLEWYQKWLREGRSVRLVLESLTGLDLEMQEAVELEDVDLTQGLEKLTQSPQFYPAKPTIIRNFQGDQLVVASWLAPLSNGWQLVVNRYLNRTDLRANDVDLTTADYFERDLPKLLQTASKRTVVALTKTIGEYEVDWSTSNFGGQSNPLLQGGSVERGDYSLKITSKKTGVVVAAIGFAGNLIEKGLDFQHAIKNQGLHPLKLQPTATEGVTTSSFEFGSLHPLGHFPLANPEHLVEPLDVNQANLLITAILAFVDRTIIPQLVITTV